MAFFNDFYRTRVYVPLLAILAYMFFSPRAKKTVYRIKEKMDSVPVGYASFFLGTISFIFCVLSIYPGKSWGGDFSQYFAQARALATGTVTEWYNRNQFIINTSCDGVGADVYPWLWAVCLAPVYKAFGYFPYTFLKVVEGIAVAGTTITLVYIYHRRMRLSNAIFLACFSAWNTVYIFYVNSIEADLICLFVVIETINIVDLYNKKSSFKWAMITGLFLFLSVQTKTMAKGVLLALICYDLLLMLKAICNKFGVINLFEVGDKNLIWTPVRIVPILGYYVLTKIAEIILPAAGGTYNDYFTLAFWRIKAGAVEYFWEFSSFFGGANRKIITIITATLTVLVLVFAIYGAIVEFKNNAYIIIYSCGMIVMLLIYNYYRIGFIYTLFPLMLMLAYLGSRHLLTKYNSRPVKYYFFCTSLTVCLMTFFASVFLVINVRVFGFNNNEIETPYVQEMFEYVKKNLTKDDVVFFFKPRVLYYFTDVSSYTWRDDDASKLDQADYALISIWFDNDNMNNAIHDEKAYELVWNNEFYYLYKKIK